MKRRDLIRFMGTGLCAAGSIKLLAGSPLLGGSVPFHRRDAVCSLPSVDVVAGENAMLSPHATTVLGDESQPNDGARHRFELSPEDFLLDGKPFQIRAGEMHPARIPHEYWRHRLQLAKAMGLNTVAFCVFWNLHEEEQGKFDFQSDSRNLGEFLKTAREEGLWVFLRPGPYVCAEWDLGGLPWWLLRTPDIRLRCSDPRFTRPVERYFHELAKVLRPHMVENGGPILLVQIENEYGSYPRRDHGYLVRLRDRWVKEGINGPFITVDGATEDYLKGVTIPGVAIGLNTGENEAQFALARRMNPGVPVMSSEVYPGWLRHWGEKDWAPNDISGLLKFYMDTRKSFSLYMFHGGTNFGFHAGANGRQHDLTSYDYAAPVNEQGRPTPAYYAYRKQLASYFAAGRTLPGIPAVIATIEIPPIRLERWSGLWEQLPHPVVSEQPQCFESLGQNQGFVLYRTRIPAGASGRLSTVVHDYSTVYLDGAITQNLSLPFREKQATLEILVQGMGHINYTGEMDGDRKGLLGQVTVGGAFLKNWEMFCFPLKSDWIMSLRKTVPAAGRQGGIFKGEFNLDTVADTYLDMSRYRKGLLWVNGCNLGYHWSERGPQRRLYCPASWLKKGANTIVVLDTELTAPQPVVGVRWPELQNG
jgi:beta-galactosidase